MMKNIQIDSIDRKLLRVLQQRADISQAALAEEIGSSPASCWRRIKALEQKGILGPTVRLLDPDAIGRPLHVISQVRMKTHEMQARTSFETFIESRDEIMECFSTSGEWDYQLGISAASMADYEEFLMHHLLNHEAVASCSSHFALKRIKYKTALPV